MKSVLLIVVVGLMLGTTFSQDALAGLTPEKMKAMVPGGGKAVDQYYPHIMNAMKSANINTQPRIAAFMAQLGHESGSFKYMQELASGRAYEGRRDLGNTQPGDGQRYKGRGPIQITGRSNYEAVSKALGHDFVKNPQDLAKPEWGFKAATWYWNKHNLNNLADQNTKSSFDQITRRINGGYNGKADRDQRWNAANNALKGTNIPTKPSGNNQPTPKPNNPRPTNPKPTNPKPTNPKPTNPKPTNPKPTNPKPTNPKPTNPKPTNPKPSNPKPTYPKPSNPTKPTRPTTPTRPSNPRPSTPTRPSTPRPPTRPSTPSRPTPSRPSTPSKPSSSRPSTPTPRPSSGRRV